MLPNISSKGSVDPRTEALIPNDMNPHGTRADLGSSRTKPWWEMQKLIKERMENKVDNFVGLNKVVSGIKWMNGMVKRRLSGGWTEI